MGQYQPPPGGYQQPYDPQQQYMKPHRGTLILVFGILSWMLCFIFGAVAWSMGNTDLRDMRAGRMDPTGEGLTQAGRILGMVSVIITIVVLALVLLGFLFFGIFAASSSGGY